MTTYTVAPSQGGVQALLASGKIVPGDVILLQDGDHGALSLRATFAATVTIRAQHRGKAHVRYIGVQGSHITIGGLAVWPNDPAVLGATLIETWPDSSFVTFQNLDVRGGQDAANYPNWPASEWLARMVDGIHIEGSHSAVINSTFTGIHFGIIMAADNRAVGNVIAGFSGDGIRPGDRTIIRGNTIRDSVSVDANHADAIQLYGGAAGVSGVTIDRNIVVQGSLALRGDMQGIGGFDGPYAGLKVTNNDVTTDMGHGIAFCGMIGGTIAGNVARPQNDLGRTAKWPWVQVFPFKDGRPSTDVTVSNNRALAFGQSDPANRVIYSGNVPLYQQ